MYLSQAIKQPRIVKIRENVLKKNDMLARELRKRFQENGVYVVNLVSSPGSGKTTLLTEVLTRLSKKYKTAALVGDLATENDAERLEKSGALVHQITTGTVCHLEAQMIEASLKQWNLAEIDFLFIENVGNLGLSVQLRFGREHPSRIVFYDRRRRQTGKIPDDRKQRRRRHHYENRFGRCGGI